MSIEASTSVDPFARTCQAAHLLGWVCEHVNQHPTPAEADMHFQEAFAISGALRALVIMLHSESSHRAQEERQRLSIPYTTSIHASKPTTSSLQAGIVA
jgi:hypothetical protein